MWARLPRRRRHLAITAGLGIVFAVAAAVLLWVGRQDSEEYQHGEDVEGLTAELARNLPDDVPRVTFTDVTAGAGIDFRHFAGTRSSQLPEDMGSGAAWGDYDNDGWLDLYVVNLAGPLTLGPDEVAASPARAALYHNEGDGTFTDVAPQAGVDVRGMGMAAAWGDYDNDGWSDLFVSAYGENRLFRNRGDGTFEERTRESGVGGKIGFWTGASWGDYDRDGLLDLYVTGYVRYSPGAGVTALQYDVVVPASLNPSTFGPERNLLFRNKGDGTFDEVAESARVEGRDGRGLSAAWADLDMDGWPDLYVANDVSDNALYQNLGDGTFRNVALGALVADYRGAMGLAVGDWDVDGDTDIFVTHWIAQENALYTSLYSKLASADPPPVDPLRFMDQADRYGLGQIALDYVGWATSFIDYDNDGRLDLFVVNGSTLQQAERLERLEPMLDQIFWNRNNEEGFYDVSPVSGPYFERELVGRGAAFGDYDNDGDIDAFIVNHGASGVLLRNDGGNRNAWLNVALEGARSNRSAVGARLRLHAGAVVQSREVGAQSSYLSQNSPVMHFGLGSQPAVDSLEILWPSGERQVIDEVPVNGRLRIVEGREPTFEEGPTSAAGSALGEPGAAPSGPQDRATVLRFWEILRRATRARIEGRLRDAAEEYGRALALRPDHEDALYYHGSVRFELGEFAVPRRDWERLVQLEPGNARGHMQLGLVLACVTNDEFDLAKAEAHFLRAFEINLQETGPLRGLAKAALVRWDVAATRAYLDGVLGLYAESPEAFFLNGYIAWKLGDAEEALGRFSTAARNARRELAADLELGEGKVLPARPLLSPGTTCRPVEALVEATLRTEAEWDRDPRERMIDAYRSLDALLERARSRAR